MALATATASGCGGGSNRASITGGPATTHSGSTTAPPPANHARPSRRTHRSHGVTVRVPRDLTAARKPAAAGAWPVPRAVLSSFPIHHASANSLCPAGVLASMPPDGVYIVVAEYTNPPPPGIPARTRPGPRGDLTHLNIRPSEVECWNGPGGSASFTEHGRSFHVELLLGRRVSASQRRRALEALASLRVSG